MFTQLNNQISAAVLEKNGRKIDEREFVNTPFAHLFPQNEFVVIDWLANSTTDRPEEAELSRPVTYNGNQWQGSWAWGSAVKTGQTVGLLNDIGHECGMIKNAEDGQRFNRWLLAQGLWGGVSGGFEIGIAKPGTIVNGMPIEDGFGYVRREIAEVGYNGLNKIKLGQAKESYTFWQRIPWDEIAEEVSPIIAETMGGPVVFTRSNGTAGASFEITARDIRFLGGHGGGNGQQPEPAATEEVIDFS